MKLSPADSTWFETMRVQWHERLKPDRSHLGAHVFDTAARVPEAAVRRARVFGSRNGALPFLPAGGRIAEVGTQTGAWARRILDGLAPTELHLFDLEFDTLRRLNPAIPKDERVHLHLGDSSTELSRMPNGFFDWIYVDGDHTLEGVRRDAAAAIAKVKADGILVFNDYTVWSMMELVDYGVVPVVNELLGSGEWELLYLALHPLMYCDVALCRVCSPGLVSR